MRHNFKIYVPSTFDVNTNIDNSDKVNETLQFLSSLFGGATATDAAFAIRRSPWTMIRRLQRYRIITGHGSASPMKRPSAGLSTSCPPPRCRARAGPSRPRSRGTTAARAGPRARTRRATRRAATGSRPPSPRAATAPRTPAAPSARAGPAAGRP